MLICCCYRRAIFVAAELGDLPARIIPSGRLLDF